MYGQSSCPTIGNYINIDIYLKCAKSENKSTVVFDDPVIQTFRNVLLHKIQKHSERGF